MNVKPGHTKIGSHDADDPPRLSVNFEVAPERRGGRSKAARGEAFAHDHHVLAPRILLRLEPAAVKRPASEQGGEIGRHKAALHDLPLSRAADRDASVAAAEDYSDILE